jgi:hypothetical protein
VRLGSSAGLEKYEYISSLLLNPTSGEARLDLRKALLLKYQYINYNDKI